MPDDGGPNAIAPRFHRVGALVIALYGAPVWHNLTRDNVATLRRPKLAIDVRAVRVYRTVSFEEAGVLA